MNIQEVPDVVETAGLPSRRSKISLLCSNGDEYHVQIIKDGQGSATFIGNGWLEFLNENNVNVWTMFLMEKVSGDRFLVKICRPRLVGDRVVWSPLQDDTYGNPANPIYVAEDTDDAEGSLSEEEEETEGDGNGDSSTALRFAMNMNTGEVEETEDLHQPSAFDVHLSTFHMSGSYLTVPNLFLRECDISGKSTVELRTDIGTFTLKIHSYFDARYPESPQVVFRNGWRNFVRENDMEVGQVIIFTVMENESFSDLLVMDVEVTDR